MTLDQIAQKLHESIQHRTKKELCTFGIQWMRYQYRAKREGFTPLTKEQFVAVMEKIRNS